MIKKHHYVFIRLVLHNTGLKLLCYGQKDLYPFIYLILEL